MFENLNELAEWTENLEPHELDSVVDAMQRIGELADTLQYITSDCHDCRLFVLFQGLRHISNDYPAATLPMRYDLMLKNVAKGATHD